MLSNVQSALAMMLAPGEALLCGVSGGADSVVLLDVLVRSGWRPQVCHLNHQWRGAESDADAEFVRQLAGRYGLPVTIEARTVPATEEGARQARFQFFAKAGQRAGIAKLALGHTADDQVETLLLRLLRGAGVPGLVGIWPERQVGGLRVIRPLLGVRRAEILEYLRQQGLSWREDSSNREPVFARNRIRHELIPLLEREYNPALREVLSRTAEILRDEDYYLLHDIAERFYLRTCQNDAVNVKMLVPLPVAVQRRLLRFWLGGEDELGGARFTFDHIESVRQLALGDSPSAQLDLPGGLVIRRDYGWLRKTSREQVVPVRGRWPVTIGGITDVQELRLRVTTEVLSAPLPAWPDGREAACLDLDALGEAPFLRTRNEGDRFRPLGMDGEKKLQDFFVDQKVPRPERRLVPLLCAADGRIAWVIGYRLGEPFKVTAETRRVLRVQVKAA